MSLNVDVSTAVDKLNHKIGFWQPLYEAISNSLEANASEIIVEIKPEDTLFDPDKNSKVCEISVRDNGDGFTGKSIESFGKLWSKHKYELGCKGIGRLTWLRVFDEVNIESVSEGQRVSIKFNRSFGPEAVKKEDCNDSSSWTLVKFKDVSEDFYKITAKKPEDNYDRRGEADAEVIKKRVEENLMAKLFLLKTKDCRNFVIKFRIGGDVAEISSNHLRELHQKHFNIPSAINGDKTEHKFTLYYAFMTDNQKVDHRNGYCANGRIVKEFGKEFKFRALPDKHSSIALLTSSYFDERVNDERNEFTFSTSDNNADINNPVPFPKINMAMKENMQEILAQEFPALLKRNDDLITECAKEYPHLRGYFEEDGNLIKNKPDLIKHAEKRFNEEKERAKSSFRKLLKSKDVSDDEYSKVVSKVSDVSARELAEYIAYRQQIIEALVKLNNDQEKQEKLLHNLFMPMRTESFSPNISASNIWLLDDKFMSYFYMASDKTISSVYKAFNYDIPTKVEGGDLKPDMLGIYCSNNCGDSEFHDVVIIEFKGVGASFSEKRKSISEVWNNTGTVRRTYPNVRGIWSFIITDIDPKLETCLEDNSFEPYFSSENGKIFHGYNKKNNVHCYAISIGALLNDANSRNSVFLDIITDKYAEGKIKVVA